MKKTIIFLPFFLLYTVAAFPALAGGIVTDTFMSGASMLFSGLSPMEEVLCTILFIIIGDAGRGIATLAVMSLGIGAMMGKVSWGQAITIAVGIAIIFGAPVLLPMILFDPSGMATDALGGTMPSLEYPCVSGVTDAITSFIGG